MGEDCVGFWDGEAEFLGVGDEGVFLVEGLGGLDVELNAETVGAALDDILYFTICDSRGYTGARDPDGNVFVVDDVEDVLDVGC